MSFWALARKKCDGNQQFNSSSSSSSSSFNINQRLRKPKRIQRKHCMLTFFSTCVCKISQMTASEKSGVFWQSWKTKLHNFTRNIQNETKRIFDKCKDVTIHSLYPLLHIRFFKQYSSVIEFVCITTHDTENEQKRRTEDGFISYIICWCT